MTTVPKVLYIVGRSRSGSTLVGNLLGQIDGVFHAGELRTLWAQLAAPPSTELIRCGCGKAVRDCPVWTEVAARIFSSPDGPQDAATVHRWEMEVPRGRRLWRIVGRKDVVAPQGVLRGYAMAMRRSYIAIREVTGARVVVDISKRPTDLLLLHAVRDVPSYLAHLVRDPRAVMHSWTRHVEWPESPLEMRRFSPWQSAVSWDARNLLAEYVRRRFGARRSARIRYEDLVAAPEETIRFLLQLVGEVTTTCPGLMKGSTAELVPGHVLGGNPGKFRTGTVEIREDREWREALTRRDRMLATAVALPLLRRYGYPLRTGPIN